MKRQKRASQVRLEAVPLGVRWEYASACTHSAFSLMEDAPAVGGQSTVREHSSRGGQAGIGTPRWQYASAGIAWARQGERIDAHASRGFSWSMSDRIRPRIPGSVHGAAVTRQPQGAPGPSSWDRVAAPHPKLARSGADRCGWNLKRGFQRYWTA